MKVAKPVIKKKKENSVKISVKKLAASRKIIQ